MNEITKTVGRSAEEERRLREAKESFQKMRKEIAPFIKRRKLKQYSTAGEWRETSSLYS